MGDLLSAMLDYWVPRRRIAEIRRPLSILREVLRKKIWNLLLESGETDPPIEPLRITRVDTLKIFYRVDNSIRSEAFIRANYDNFEIVYRTRNKEGRLIPLVRVRFTLAHELSHLFAFSLRERPPRPLGISTGWETEGFFNELAREFLIPSYFLLKEDSPVQEYIRKPLLDNFLILMKTFQVSSDVLAIRLIKDLSLWDALFVKGTLVKGSELRPHLLLKGPSFRNFKVRPALESVNKKINLGEDLSQPQRGLIRIRRKKYPFELLFYKNSADDREKRFILLIR